jgi:DNA-binding MarR family transcriptional regulator
MQVLTPNKLGALGILIADAMESALNDLSPSAASMLSTLFFRPDLTASTLAEIVGITQPTATRVLDGLVQHGWIERQERQGRATPLRLTAAGGERAVALQSARHAALSHLTASLSDYDRKAFDRILDSILAEATTSRAFARTICRLCDHAACDGRSCPIGSRATELERHSQPDVR